MRNGTPPAAGGPAPSPSCRHRPWLAAALATVLLIVASAGRAITLLDSPVVPDALTAADSLQAIVIATCVRGSSDTLPADFTVDRYLGGSAPDSFTAYPFRDDAHCVLTLREGECYLLLLRDAPPPLGPECRRAFPWRASARFEVAWSEGVTVGAVDDFEARGREFWSLPGRSSAGQAAVLANWVSGGWSGWASAALSRHPGVWSAPLRDACLDRLERGDDAGGSQMLPVLAMHPDTATRAVFRRLAAGDSRRWEAALRLVARDSSVWVRRTVRRLGERILAGMRAPAGTALCAEMGGWAPGEPWTASALVTVLSADRSPGARDLLIRMGWGTPRCQWMRHEVLRALADDTSHAARALLWDTIRGDPVLRCPQFEGVPGPLEAVRCLTTGELRGALRDTSEGIVGAVVAEAMRRRDPVVADTVIAWLRGDRLGDRHGLPLYLACYFIPRLGEVRHPVAFGLLRAWGEIPDDQVRMAVMAGLQSLGDRRAAPYFRRLARVPCDQMEYFAKRSLAQGLMELGDASDADLFVRWAHDCPDVRDVALEAIGTLAGPRRMVEVIREIEPLPLRPEAARQYEWIEASARQRRERRGPGAAE